jgi:hypothetical protein
MQLLNTVSKLHVHAKLCQRSRRCVCVLNARLGCRSNAYAHVRVWGSLHELLEITDCLMLCGESVAAHRAMRLVLVVGHLSCMQLLQEAAL